MDEPVVHVRPAIAGQRGAVVSQEPARQAFELVPTFAQGCDATVALPIEENEGLVPGLEERDLRIGFDEER